MDYIRLKTKQLNLIGRQIKFSKYQESANLLNEKYNFQS